MIKRVRNKTIGSSRLSNITQSFFKLKHNEEQFMIHCNESKIKTQNLVAVNIPKDIISPSVKNQIDEQMKGNMPY